MEFLHYNQQHQVLICTRCQSGIAPRQLSHHLRHHHAQEITSLELQDCVRKTRLFQLEKPSVIRQRIIPSDVPRIPYLATYPGHLCNLCHHFVCRDLRRMGEHLREQHPEQEISFRRGRPPGSDRSQVRAHGRASHTTPVTCQTFFLGPFRRYFPVQVQVQAPAPQPSATRAQTRAPSLSSSIPEQMRAKLAQKRQSQQNRIETVQPTDVSPWLELTRWPVYLHGRNLVETASLIQRPGPAPASDDERSREEVQEDQALRVLEASFDRVIEQARSSLVEEKVNVFDQHRINSFLPHRSRNRPIYHKLREGTYKAYRDVWHRLLAFLYRADRIKPSVDPPLSFQLTDEQSACLDRVLALIQDGIEPETTQTLDRRLLELCIALLDHSLQGNIYDSVVIAFLAVLGINPQNNRYHDAAHYTTKLSAFIKIAQLLVLQQAVAAAEQGKVEFPSNCLEAMQDRFMVLGSRSPMNWALKLRAYGLKVRDCTTSIGYLLWSEDKGRLTYKDMELDMTSLRELIRTEVQQAQDRLEKLLLLHPDEERDATVPALDLLSIKDDPSRAQVGWSFLQDPRNGALAGRDEWILDRVLHHDWLKREFLATKAGSRWKQVAVRQYLRQVDQFLESLLLLVHLTGGQPARGTELLSLRHRNTTHAIRRSIFIEDGLVTFVTFYHKGYSITGSTKIIHRYLPREVGELVLYYLWLVEPFCGQLRILALDQDAPDESLLWGHQGTPWPSSRLSEVIRRAFWMHLQTHMNLVYWRHAAIGISRAHLNRGQFKRDYDLLEDIRDAQAAHTSSLAGSVYARGVQDAPGHVAAMQREYRLISREWHFFLGFTPVMAARRTPLAERTPNLSYGAMGQMAGWSALGSTANFKSLKRQYKEAFPNQDPSPLPSPSMIRRSARTTHPGYPVV
jgi:hypothetical protein